MSTIGRLDLPDVRDWSVGLPDVCEWSRSPPECPRVVGRISRMSGSGREANPDVRELFRRPPWVSVIGREALLNVRE